MLERTDPSGPLNTGGIPATDPGSWAKGTATVKVDKDTPLYVSISMGGVVTGDCVLVDDVKFVKR